MVLTSSSLKVCRHTTEEALLQVLAVLVDYEKHENGKSAEQTFLHVLW